MPDQTLPGIKSLFSQTFRFTQLHIKNLFVILAIPVVLQGLFFALTPYIDSIFSNINFDSFGVIKIISAIGLLCLEIALPIFAIFISAVSIKYIINADSGILGVRNAYSNTLPYILSFIWVGIVCVLTLTGTFILFVIPGLIAMVFIGFSFIVVLEGKYKGVSALSFSTILVKGNWWKVFGRIILLVLLNMAVTAVIVLAIFGFEFVLSGSWSLWESITNGSDIYNVSILIAGLITNLFSAPYMYMLYSSLKKLKEQEVTPERINKFKPLYTGLSIWGLIVGILFVLIFIALVFVNILSEIEEKKSGQYSDSQSLLGMSTVTYTDPQGMFEILHPDTWETSKEKNCTYLIAPIRNYDSLSRGSVMICEFPVYPGTTLEGLAQSVDTDFKTTIQDVANERETIKTERVILAGIPAIRYFTSKKRSLDGGTTYFTQISEETFFFKGEAGYNVAYKNNIVEYESLRPKGMEIVTSFKLLK